MQPPAAGAVDEHERLASNAAAFVEHCRERRTRLLAFVFHRELGCAHAHVQHDALPSPLAVTANSGTHTSETMIGLLIVVSLSLTVLFKNGNPQKV